MIELRKSDSPISEAWRNHYSNKRGAYSRFDAVCFSDLLRNFSQGAMSDTLRAALPKIQAALPDRTGGLFCDVPLPTLWLELAMNQIGFPYHCNVHRHFRGTYRAKTRKMAFDIFVFDQCRALYDWISIPEFFADDLGVLERQIITRSCMDAIGKQQRWVLPHCLFGSALIGEHNRSWALCPSFPIRFELSDTTANGS